MLEFDDCENLPFLPNKTVYICIKCKSVNSNQISRCGNCGERLTKELPLYGSYGGEKESDYRYIAFEVSREYLIKKGIPDAHLANVTRGGMYSFCNNIYKLIKDEFDIKQAFYDFFENKT
jgi:hypothetical protein